LQQQYGDDFLAEICATYPRNAHRIDGLLEQPLSLSCIEAARLVLQNPQLMPRYALGPSTYSRFLNMPGQAVSQTGNQFRYFWDVREFCLLLVQDRSYPLWQRLFILGAFCKRLGEQVGSRQFALVPKLLHDYAEITSSGKLRSAMEEIPIRAHAQLEMVMQVALGYLRQHKPGLCRIHEYLQEFLQGIGYQPEATPEVCTLHYVEAYTHYYRPFMEQNPFLLENYLINHIFRVVFPFGQVPAQSFEHPQREYLQVCLEVAVIKGLLIGIAGHHREAFGTEHVVKLIQALAKAMEHDPRITETINWKTLSDTSCVAALLKN
jgi:lysine-N-methylase